MRDLKIIYNINDGKKELAAIAISKQSTITSTSDVSQYDAEVRA